MRLVSKAVKGLMHCCTTGRIALQLWKKIDSKSAEGNPMGFDSPSRHHISINRLGVFLASLNRRPFWCW